MRDFASLNEVERLRQKTPAVVADAVPTTMIAGWFAIFR
jgi:hypothetical protein